MTRGPLPTQTRFLSVPPVDHVVRAGGIDLPYLLVTWTNTPATQSLECNGTSRSVDLNRLRGSLNGDETLTHIPPNPGILYVIAIVCRLPHADGVSAKPALAGTYRVVG